MARPTSPRLNAPVIAGGMALALLAAALGWWWLSAGTSPADDAGAGAVPVPPRSAADPAFTAVPAEDARAPRAVDRAAEPLSAASQPPPSAAVAAAADPLAVVVQGRVLDGSGEQGAGAHAGAKPGAPVAGAHVYFAADTAAAWTLHWDIVSKGRDGVPGHAVTDAAGRFELPARASAPAAPGDDEAQPRLIVLSDAHAVLVRRCDGLQPGRHAVGDLLLESGATLIGRTLGAASTVRAANAAADGSRVPLPGVDAAAADAASAAAGGRDAAEDERVREFFLAARSGEDGRFRITGLLGGAGEVTLSARGLRSVTLPELELRTGSTLDLGDIVIDAGASIAGAVTDGAGARLQGVSVQAILEPGGAADPASSGPEASLGERYSARGNASTGADGRFEITGLLPGRYALHASSRDYVWHHAHDIETGRGDVRLALRRYGALLVRVVAAADSAPLAGATVVATLPDEFKFQPWSEWQYQVVAGAEAGLAPGEFRVSGAGPEGTELQVSAPEHLSQRVRAPGVGAGETASVDVRLSAGLSVSGRVLDDAGVVLSGARVTLTVVPGAGARGADVQHAAAQQQSVTADDAGGFRFGGAPPGVCRLVAEAAGHAPSAPRDVELLAGALPPQPVDLVLLRHGALTGLVRDAQGLPAAAVRVALARLPSAVDAESDDDVEKRLRDAITDAEGRFVLADLVPGSYDAWISRGELDRVFALAWAGAADGAADVQAQRARALVRRFEVRPAETTELLLDVPRACTVRGRVLVAGVPAAGSLVALTPADVDLSQGGRAVAVAGATTDAAGRFEFRELPAGSLAVVAQAPGAVVPCVEVLTLEPGQTMERDLEARGVRVEGRITDADSHAPLAGIAVAVGPYLDPAVHAGVRLWGLRFTNVVENLEPAMDLRLDTDADGRFTLNWLPPGRYTLWFSNARYLEDALSFDVTDTAGPEPLSVELHAAAAIEGVLTHAGLAPLPSLYLSVHDADGRRVSGGAWAESNGHFLLETLPAGVMTLRVSVRDESAEPDPFRMVASRSVVLEAGRTLQVELPVDV